MAIGGKIMRWIEKNDIERINACITSRRQKIFPQDSYFKTITDFDNDIMPIEYTSLPEIEAEMIRLNPNIDKKLLRNIIITSVKARAKYERELDSDIYAEAELHKNDIPAFIYVF